MLLMFQTRCKCSKHVSNVYNALRIFKIRFKCFKRVTVIFKTRFKCFKRVANIQNTLLIFQTRCEYSKHVANASNPLLIFKNAFQIFQTIFKTRC